MGEEGGGGYYGVDEGFHEGGVAVEGVEGVVEAVADEDLEGW